MIIILCQKEIIQIYTVRQFLSYLKIIKLFICLHIEQKLK
jgi:hypothetical protein